MRRALASALVVGPVLVAINHGDAILSGDVSPGRLLRIALTVIIPYAVSTFSSVQAAPRSQPHETVGPEEPNQLSRIG